MLVTSAVGAGRASGDALRVVIAGGGTGGHLFPGIAVAREIRRRRPDAEIVFAGTAQGIEARVLPLEGYALDLVRIGGVKGKSLMARARGVSLVPFGLVDAWRIVSDRRPHLVIGVGGYSAGPVVLVAALRGIPTMLLEQNAVPGLTNRLLAPFVRAAAVSFETTVQFFRAKAFVSGNPVRPEFLTMVAKNAQQDTSGTRLLVFGGSQGAHAINLAMIDAARELVDRVPGLRLTHQTGVRDLDLVQAAYRTVGLNADVAPFFDDLALRLVESDLVVCRAGATTLAEITAAGKPAILIPLPTATDDHQRKNAEGLAAAGAASVLIQSEMTGHELADRVARLVADDGARKRMSVAARAMGRPDAAAAIVDRALELVGAR